MKANELRIGNYVTYDNKHNIPVKIKGLNIDAVDTGYRKFLFYDKIFPIPLTEEWLLKFGYDFYGVVVENENESYKRYVHYNLLGTSNHEVHIIESNYGDNPFIEYVTSIDNDERQYNYRMDFVHDLQNAVFKETGIELTIDL